MRGFRQKGGDTDVFKEQLVGMPAADPGCRAVVGLAGRGGRLLLKGRMSLLTWSISATWQLPRELKPNQRSARKSARAVERSHSAKWILS